MNRSNPRHRITPMTAQTDLIAIPESVLTLNV